MDCALLTRAFEMGDPFIFLYISPFSYVVSWPYRLDQDWIGTVEMAFCGEPSITRSL